jgi:hypothetical protein
MRALLLFGVGLAWPSGPPLNAQTYQATLPTKADVEQLIQALRLRHKREGWRFEIGSTELLSRSIAELTGAEKGLPSRKLLEARRDFAVRALTLYDEAKRRLGVEDSALEGAVCRPRSKSFSWHSNGYSLRPESQTTEGGITCGACWAFAPIAAYESTYLIENRLRATAIPRSVSASEQHLLNCTPDSTCTLGYVYKALDMLVLAGTSNRSVAPYVGSKLSCQKTDRIDYHAVAWGPAILDSAAVASPKRIKDLLCTFGPVTSRIMITPSLVIYSGASPFHTTDPVSAIDPKSHAHHLVIVGWDDNKGRNGAWLVKNSWGDGWGMTDEGMPGYAWIEYGANLIGHHVNWVKAFHVSVTPEALGPEYARLKQEYLIEASVDK